MVLSDEQESMTTDTVKLALELSEDEAYTLQSAGEKLRDALRAADSSPRCPMLTLRCTARLRRRLGLPDRVETVESTTVPGSIPLFPPATSETSGPCARR